MLSLIAQQASPSVWVRSKVDDWWKNVVPSFTDEPWIANFRMSRDTFQYVCRRLKPSLERMDTTYRLAVQLEKRVAVAIWKLATNYSIGA